MHTSRLQAPSTPRRICGRPGAFKRASLWPFGSGSESAATRIDWLLGIFLAQTCEACPDTDSNQVPKLHEPSDPRSTLSAVNCPWRFKR